MIDLAKVLTEKYPDRRWEERGNDYARLKFTDGGKKIPYKELELKYKELIKEEEINKYLKKREIEYPTIEEQLDMLYHSMNNGEIPKATEWFTTIHNIKLKYPKP
jgi:hypothetical protein